MKNLFLMSLIATSVLVGCGGSGGSKTSSSLAITSQSSLVSSSVQQSSAADSSSAQESSADISSEASSLVSSDGAAESSDISSDVSSQSSQSSESSNSSESVLLVGYFIDSAIANLPYRTETQSGVTGNQGEYHYFQGESVEFILGGLILGPVLAKDVLTPQDFFPEEPLENVALVNFLRLLQTLDADEDLENGINLPDLSSVDMSTLHFSAPDFDNTAGVINVLQQLNIEELVSAEDALFHFNSTLDYLAAASQWSIYSGDELPFTPGAVKQGLSQVGQFDRSAEGVEEYFTQNSGTVTFDTRSSAAATASALIPNIVNGDEQYPKTFTLIAGLSGLSGVTSRILDIEIAMADTGKTGSRIKAVLRNDGSNRGIQLERANDGNNVNNFGIADMDKFAIYQFAISLSSATTGSVKVYRNGQELSGLSLTEVTMSETTANHLRIGDMGSNAYAAVIDWMAWTNADAYTPAEAAARLPFYANLGCVYGYGQANNDTTCGEISNGGTAPGDGPGTGTGASNAPDIETLFTPSSIIRPARLEGYGAHANVTGGAGGQVVYVTTGTELNSALCRADRTSPVIIMVNGLINHGNTTAQGCDTQADVIEIKKQSNVSIIGVGSNAIFDQIGIHIRDASNIVIQNVHIRNVKKSGTPTSNGGDAIGIETRVDKVWIDHNTLEASGGEKDGYDSLLDMKAGVTNVTVSYNLFRDSSRGGLIGSSDSDNKNANITFHHNWYKNIEQRTPLIRHANVHTYNNLWSHIDMKKMIHGINVRMNGKALVEGNYFHNTNNPLLASDDSSVPGCWKTNNDNVMAPEIYYSRQVGNGALVLPTFIDGQAQSTCDTSVPYLYQLDAAVDVPAIVMANAGVGIINTGAAISSSSEHSSAPSSTSSATSSITSSIPSTGSSAPASSSQSSSNESSSSESSAVSSDSSSSASSESDNHLVNTALPFFDDFNDVVDSTSFFTKNYKSLASAEEPFYVSRSGKVTYAEGAITLAAARLVLASTQADVDTKGADTVTVGEFDFTKPYRISFCVRSAAPSGSTKKVQIYVDNNTTSGASSIHGNASRIYNENVGNLAENQRVVINANVGTKTSFITLRTESDVVLTIDDLWLGYQDATTDEPSSESCSN